MSHDACVKGRCRCDCPPCRVEREQKEVLGAYEWARPPGFTRKGRLRAPSKPRLVYWLGAWADGRAKP